MWLELRSRVIFDAEPIGFRGSHFPRRHPSRSMFCDSAFREIACEASNSECTVVNKADCRSLHPRIHPSTSAVFRSSGSSLGRRNFSRLVSLRCQVVSTTRGRQLFVAGQDGRGDFASIPSLRGGLEHEINRKFGGNRIAFVHRGLKSPLFGGRQRERRAGTKSRMTCKSEGLPSVPTVS